MLQLKLQYHRMMIVLIKHQDCTVVAPILLMVLF